MTDAVFQTLLDARIQKMRDVLANKAKEYASNADRLHNFKQAAAMTRTTPAKALVGMLAKHLVSIFDMVDQIAPPKTETIDEKIGDAINYLVLLEAILKEQTGA